MNKKALRYTTSLIMIVVLVIMVALFSQTTNTLNGYTVKAFVVKKPSPEWLTTGCSDSDSSSPKKNDMLKPIDIYKYFNIKEQGTVSVKGMKLNPRATTDTCINRQGQAGAEGPRVREWYCQLLPGGKILHAYEQVDCPHGTSCKNGACVK